MATQNFKNNNTSLPLDTSVGHQYDRRVESGRSMVEMLGTLAIMGVLAVGGIMGYKYGMDKYRANETVNDVNLRMLDLAHQIDQHPTSDPNISNEWGIHGKFYPMDVVYDDITSEYAIEVNDVPRSVCNMVFDNLISSYSIEVGTMRYEDSNVSDICGENNTMAFYLNDFQNDTEICNPDDCAICHTCDENNRTCIPVADNTPCTIDDENGVCLSGICKTPCGTNGPCPAGYFCQAGKHCGGTDYSCESLYSVCPTAVHPFSFEYNGEQFTWYALWPVYIRSQDSAINACKALGKNLITPADVEPREKSNAAYVALMEIPRFQKFPLKGVFFSYADDGPCNQKAAILYSPDSKKTLVFDYNGYSIKAAPEGESECGSGSWFICK